MKREPIKPDLINKMIVQTARQNERDKRERIDERTINSAVLQAAGSNNQNQSQRRSWFNR